MHSPTRDSQLSMTKAIFILADRSNRRTKWLREAVSVTILMSAALGLQFPLPSETSYPCESDLTSTPIAMLRAPFNVGVPHKWRNRTYMSQSRSNEINRLASHSRGKHAGIPPHLAVGHRLCSQFAKGWTKRKTTNKHFSQKPAKMSSRSGRCERDHSSTKNAHKINIKIIIIFIITIYTYISPLFIPNGCCGEWSRLSSFLLLFLACSNRTHAPSSASDDDGEVDNWYHRSIILCPLGTSEFVYPAHCQNIHDDDKRHRIWIFALIFHPLERRFPCFAWKDILHTFIHAFQFWLSPYSIPPRNSFRCMTAWIIWPECSGGGGDGGVIFLLLTVRHNWQFVEMLLLRCSRRPPPPTAQLTEDTVSENKTASTRVLTLIPQWQLNDRKTTGGELAFFVWLNVWSFCVYTRRCHELQNPTI